MAYTPKTNWQKGEVLEAADMNRVEGGLSDVYTRLDTAATTSITLKAGLQTITSDRDKPFNLTSARGRLLLNLQGRAGNFETLTGWTSAGVTIALNTANAQYGSNCAQITLGSTSGRISRTVNTVSGKMYVAAVEIKIGTATNARVDVTGQGGGVLVTSTSGYQISYMAFTANATSHSVGLTINGANGQTVFVDGFRVYEVTPSEYNAVSSLNADGFAGKYPYTEGIAGVKNPYAIRWTDSTKTQLAAMLAFETELFASLTTDADAEAEFLYPGKDGQYYKTALWHKYVISGDFANYIGVDNGTGYKGVRLRLPVSPTKDTGYGVKFNGNLLPRVAQGASPTASDQQIVLDSADSVPNSLLVTVSVADSGWGDSYTPNENEVRAYFYGWKMYDSGTYTAAQAQAATTATYTGSGTKQWVNLVGTAAGSNLPTTQVPGYTPYELIYRRASQIVAPVASEGALSLVEGSNVIEMGTGLVIRESTRPLLYPGTTDRYMTNYTSGGGSINPFVHSPASVLQMYENGRPTTFSSGITSDKVTWKNGVYVDRIDGYAPEKTYSVTYFRANKFPVVDIKGSTNDNERAILNDLVRDVEQVTRRLSVAELRKPEKESVAPWITPTMLNAWSPDSNNPAAYRKRDGSVNFTGVVLNGVVTNGTVIFRLPEGFRPLQEHHFSCYAYQISDGSYGTVEIIIRVNGDVVVGLGGRSYISFAGISYVVF